MHSVTDIKMPIADYKVLTVYTRVEVTPAYKSPPKKRVPM